LQDIDRNKHTGFGRPEQLKGDFQSYWSRRIDETNRLVYRIVEGRIEIFQCRTLCGDM
jgi:toxin YoeB